MNVSDEIIRYVSERETSGALLLTGQWGCGKTYRIKHLAESHMKEMSVIFISLFGISTVTSLKIKIKEQVAFSIFPTVQEKKHKLEKCKVFRAFIDGLSHQAKIAEKYAAITAFAPIKAELGFGKKKRKLVLVFDDIERSDIPIKELMGVINECVESEKIKTILIADEEKIKSDDYREFKEKVISHTIKLNPDYSLVIRDILSAYQTEKAEYKEFLMRQEYYIVQLFKESNSYNLRTLKTILVDFERIFISLCELNYSEEIACNILYTFAAMTFERVSGKYVPDEFGYLSADTKLAKKYAAFHTEKGKMETVQKLVTDFEWNQEDFHKEYRERFCKGDLSDEEKFMRWNFWDLNDLIVKNGFPLVIQKAYCGDLTCESLINLIQKIVTARINKINLPVAVDYKKIEAGFKNRIIRMKKCEICEPQLHTFISEKDKELLSKDESKLYDIIFKVGSELVPLWENRRMFIDAMQKGDEHAIRNLNKHDYVSLDQDMVNSLYVRYNSSGRDVKGAITWIMENFHIKTFEDQTKFELDLSIRCFELLMKKISFHEEQEKDSFSQIIDRKFSDILSKRIMALQSDSSSQSVPNCFDSDE